MYDVNNIRKDFPILNRTVYNRPLVYLDNAATTQKPNAVLDAMHEAYVTINANVHRGVHYLSQKATDKHEEARQRVKQFINARKTEEIIFTRGTTEAINLVATTFCQNFVGKNDEILVSQLEHHSNIVSWQLQAARVGAVVKPIPINDNGEIDIDAYKKLFNEQTRIVSIAHVSNVLGTINPIDKLIAIAHEHNVPIMIDGAQSAPHFTVDMQKLDCDFFAFSGHKMYAPTGIGVLYGKEEWLDKLPPYQGGGEMIDHVSFKGTTFQSLPFKFEAGTPDYIATHGLATAIDYIEKIGFENIKKHEQELTTHCVEQLKQIEQVNIYGHKGPAEAVVSFNVEGIHHLDIGTLLDHLGIAVRTGHHCAEPLMNSLKIEGAVRASFALYNTIDEIDTFINALKKVIKMF